MSAQDKGPMQKELFEAFMDAVRKPVEQPEKSLNTVVENIARGSLFQREEQFHFDNDNDNDGAWLLIPFPDGWYGAC